MYRIQRLQSGLMLLKSVDQVSLGCGMASVIMMTDMCGCRRHPLKVGLRFLVPCIRYVSLFEQVLSILMTTVAVFIGCVSFSLVRICFTRVVSSE